MNTAVPCRYCGKPTSATGSRTCSACWEVARHLDDLTDIAHTAFGRQALAAACVRTLRELAPTFYKDLELPSPMNTARHVRLLDYLTASQIAAAKVLYEKHGDKALSDIRDEVIQPNLGDINKKLASDNNPTYLAYATIYVFQQNKKEPGRYSERPDNSQ